MTDVQDKIHFSQAQLDETLGFLSPTHELFRDALDEEAE